MCRETLTQAEFLRALHNGRTDFSSCIFTETTAYDSSTKINDTSGAPVILVTPPAQTSKLIFELCEFQREFHLHDVQCEMISFKGAEFRARTSLGRITTACMDVRFASCEGWFSVTNSVSLWNLFADAKMKAGFMFKRFDACVVNMDRVISPESFFDEEHFVSFSALAAEFGNRTPVPLGDLIKTDKLTRAAVR